MLNIVGRYTDTNRRLRSDAKKMEVTINNTTIEKVDSMRYLGQWFMKNASAKSHIDKVLNKSNIATSKLRHLLRSSRISTDTKTMFYKCIIRPIVCYASPIWANPSTTSSAQMERIRLSERKILRSTTNTYRERGSFMYANNSLLYQRSKTVRVDRFIANQALTFIDRCAESEDRDINILARYGGMTDPKYLSIAFWAKWRSNNSLMDNNELLIYNRSQRGAPRQVYNTNQ